MKGCRKTIMWLMAASIITTSNVNAGEDESTYINPGVNGQFSINYSALNDAKELSHEDKVLITHSLRARTGYVEAQSTKGISAKCHTGPVGCKVIMDPTATKIMSQAGAFVITNAICLVVDAADGEVTEPICDLVLEAVVESTIMPVLTQCADKGDSTEIELDFWLIPPKVKANAQCQK